MLDKLEVNGVEEENGVDPLKALPGGGEVVVAPVGLVDDGVE